MTADDTSRLGFLHHPRLVPSSVWSTNPARWATFLRETNLADTPLVPTLSDILAAFTVGVVYVWQRYHRLQVPRPLMVLEWQHWPTFFFYQNPPAHVLVANVPVFHAFAGHRIDEWITIQKDHEPPIFTGPIRLWAELAGVEEAHHGIYFGLRPFRGVLPPDRGVADHYAQDHEYAALRACVRYARTHAFPRQTTEVLTQSYWTACLQRRQARFLPVAPEGLRVGE